MSKFTEKAKAVVSSRDFTSGLLTALLIAVIVFVNIIASLVTETFGLYFGSMDTVDLTITGETDSLFAEVMEKGEPLKVTFCMAESDLEVYDTGAYVLETARQFAERYPFIELNFVNLYTKMDKDGNIVDLSKDLVDMRGNELPLRRHSIIFSYGEGERENYRVLTDTATSYGFSDFYMMSADGTPIAYVGEEVFASMLAWVLHKEHKVAYITEGHGETIDVAFGNLLSSAGYYIDVIDLKKSEADTKLAKDDVGLVIISNPTTDFEIGVEGGGAAVRAELDRLATYLASGGQLYIALDAYGDRLPELENFLLKRGIAISGGEGDYGYSRDIIVDSASAIALDSLSFITGYADGPLASAIGKKANGNVLLSEVSSLILKSNEKSTVEPLLYTADTAVAMREGKTVSTGRYTVAAVSTTTEKGGAESRIFVAPTALLTNGDLLVSGYANKGFLYALLEEAFGSNVGIYGTKSIDFTYGVVENLTQRDSIIYTIILVALPVAVAAVGAVIIIRRKNR